MHAPAQDVATRRSRWADPRGSTTHGTRTSTRTETEGDSIVMPLTCRPLGHYTRRAFQVDSRRDCPRPESSLMMPASFLSSTSSEARPEEMVMFTSTALPAAVRDFRPGWFEPVISARRLVSSTIGARDFMVRCPSCRKAYHRDCQDRGGRTAEAYRSSSRCSPASLPPSWFVERAGRTASPATTAALKVQTGCAHKRCRSVAGTAGSGQRPNRHRNASSKPVTAVLGHAELR